MHRTAAGLAFMLSTTLTLAAHAGPGLTPNGDPSASGERAAPVPSALNPTWKRWSPEWPAPRTGAFGVMDPSHGRMVLFGGRDFSDTWLLDLAGDTWTQVTTDVHPGPRFDYATIHDPVRNRMLVFGGWELATSEVWALDLSGAPTWSLLATAGTPPSPRESRAIYDPVRDRMIVFGGFRDPQHFNETWELTLSGTPTWQQLSPSGEPPLPRRGHTAIYDPAGDRMIVFGGYSDLGYLNDVWSLDLATSAWRQLAPGGDTPPVRYGHTATYDPDRREMVVFGGYNDLFYNGESHRVWLNDLYVLSLGASPRWTRVTGATQPAPRYFHAAVYDAPHRRIVIFGGDADVMFSDVWALDTGTRTWSRLGPSPTGPPPRLGTYAVMDANSHRMVMFGGLGGAYFEDTWTLALDENAPRWDALPIRVHPSMRAFAATAYDIARDRMLLFGGFDGRYRPNYSSHENDVWALDLTGAPAWSYLEISGVPPTGRESQAIYDPLRDRMLLIGGASLSDPLYYLNETFELTLSGTLKWNQLFPNGPLPERREQHSLIYDPVEDRVLLFGGARGTRSFNDVWALELHGEPHWVPIPTIGEGPGPREGASATYDPVRRQMIVFGGIGVDGEILDDAWALALDRAPRWTRIDASPHPGPSAYHTMVYDPDRDRFMLSRFNGEPLIEEELWELRFANPNLPPLAAALTADSAPRLRVQGATFDGASRAPVVRFQLPDVSPARIELYDLAGRRLANRSFVPDGPGRNTVTLSEAGALHAGIYFVRVSQGGRSDVGRAVITP